MVSVTEWMETILVHLETLARTAMWLSIAVFLFRFHALLAGVARRFRLAENKVPKRGSTRGLRVWRIMEQRKREAREAAGVSDEEYAREEIWNG